MPQTAFEQRFGLTDSKPITGDFPRKARLSLVFMLEDLVNRGYLEPWDKVHHELHRIGATTDRIIDHVPEHEYFRRTRFLLERLDWRKVYSFCERVYRKLLKRVEKYSSEAGGMVEDVPLAEVRQYYEEELNDILSEYNVAFHFVDGQFQRRGRAHTQASFQRMGTVLSQPRLLAVQSHFGKARRFFERSPDPDNENCVKEAICALEATLEELTRRPASKDFAKVAKQLQGIGQGQVPPPLAEAMIKIHAYRGAARGVAHAAPQGIPVSETEAELILNLVASFVTYLADLFPEDEDISF